jgi:hypothetical protein
MKSILKNTVLVITLVLLSSFAFADSLSLVSANSGTTPNGGENVGPYGVTVNGALENLYCLDLDRTVNVGEFWVATPTVLNTDSPTDEKEAAIILSEINSGKISNVAGQLELWAILDFKDAVADGLNFNEEFDLSNARFEATLGDQFGNSFYNEFIDYVAQPDKSGNSLAQDFIGENVAVTPAVPEPSSLVLLGTGLFSAAGMAFRRAKSIAVR